MNQAEFFTQVAKLLDDPVKHTKHTLARNHRGWTCNPDSEEAKCWCLMGAMIKVNEEQCVKNYYSALVGTVKLTSISAKLGYKSVNELNDNGGYDMVMQALAIAQDEELNGA